MCIMVCLFFFFFFKQKTAYEMRISDWSSDVCSSDLHARAGGGVVGVADGQRIIRRCGALRPHGGAVITFGAAVVTECAAGVAEIGRASCRERGWQYV